MIARSNFITEVYELDCKGDLEGAMRKLYSQVLYELKSLEQRDEYIDEFMSMEFSAMVQVALARATKPFKDALKNRAKFIEVLKRNLHTECPTAEEAENVLSHVA